jgi:hypothetical protein
MRGELLEIAHRCRVMSDRTIDLSAAGEFRKLAERLENLAGDVEINKRSGRGIGDGQTLTEQLI